MEILDVLFARVPPSFEDPEDNVGLPCHCDGDYWEDTFALSCVWCVVIIFSVYDLLQLFQKSSVDLSKLCDLIISQPEVATIIKVCLQMMLPTYCLVISTICHGDWVAMDLALGNMHVLLNY